MDPSSLRPAALAVAAILATALAVPGSAQDGFFAQGGVTASAAVPSQAELDQLLAPIALYPDDLLSQVLAASTYPLEVVSLRRWLDAHPGLSGQALSDALAPEPWDESVKALAAFPSLVAMMDGQLEWTQRLGDAFLASQAAVMDTVQRLRAKASEAGNLQDNERTRVIVERDVIRIEPAAPDVIYVPVYDPWTVYGPWWWPGYPPYAWGVTYFGPWDYWAGGLYFGAGFYVGGWWHDHHTHPDWHGHDVHWSHPGRQDAWHHDSGHRGGVPYVHPATRERYGSGHAPSSGNRQPFRGFDVPPRASGAPQGSHAFGSSPRGFAPSAPAARPGSTPPAHAFSRPAPSSSAPAHAFSRGPASSSPISPGSGFAQQSARGHASLGGASPSHGGGSAPAHSGSAPSSHSGGAPSSHSGGAPSSHPGGRSR